MFSLKKNRVGLAVLPAMVLILVMCAGYAAAAEKYPRKAITIIVPFAPGGGVDLAARVVADFLSKEWAVPVNVVNKEGGNTVIGTLEVMKSKPDGYTVLADNPSSASFQVILPDLPYKIEDRTNLAVAVAGPMVFAVNGKSPWKSLGDVAASAKKEPENFKWGSLGGVSVADFGQQQFFAAAAIDLSRAKIVRFKGAGDAVMALAGGHIDFTCAGPPAVLSYVQAGTIRVIAGTGPLRNLPDVRLASDQGFPTVTALTWQGYSGPPGVPKAVVTAWEQALEKVTKNPDFKTRIEKIQYSPWFLKSEPWRSRVQQEAEAARKFFRVPSK